MCARCEELEEEVAYLKSELGIQQQVERVETIHRRLKVTPQTARMILALYDAKGRTVDKYRLMGLLPLHSPGMDDDRNVELIKTLVCYARRKLGDDAIVTAWGRGNSLSPAGMARVAAILTPQPERAAA